MGAVSNPECNAIVVLILHVIPLIGAYIATSKFMKMPARSIGSLVYSLLPLLSLVSAIDNFLVAQKLQAGMMHFLIVFYAVILGESVDQYHHEIGFLSGLPLMHA